LYLSAGALGQPRRYHSGVPVSYADINKTAALIEIARQKSNYVPELSFGTHFFQDLVEANIRYLPLYPDEKGVIFNTAFFNTAAKISCPTCCLSMPICRML
jgi:hypothetical protein